MKNANAWRRWTRPLLGAGLAMGLMAGSLAVPPVVSAETLRPAPELRHAVPPALNQSPPPGYGRVSDDRWRDHARYDRHRYDRPRYDHGRYDRHRYGRHGYDGYRPYAWNRPHRPGYWWGSTPAPGQWVWNGWGWVWVPGY